MCGRFYVEPDDEYFLELAGRISSSPLMNRLGGKLPTDGPGRYGGEVPPSSVAPVLAPNREGKQTVFPMQWGFALPAAADRKPSLMINARSETAAEKPLFRDSWFNRRCAIPATAYFEWEHRMGYDGRLKTGPKYRIAPVSGDKIFLAGLYRIQDGLPFFVILTRAPAENLFWMHDRMPLMLPENMVEGWIRPGENPEKYLLSAVTDMAWEKMQAAE